MYPANPKDAPGAIERQRRHPKARSSYALKPLLYEISLTKYHFLDNMMI
jgi:hypothetical protein